MGLLGCYRGRAKVDNRSKLDDQDNGEIREVEQLADQWPGNRFSRA